MVTAVVEEPAVLMYVATLALYITICIDKNIVKGWCEVC
jgi:hypothetical protein